MAVHTNASGGGGLDTDELTALEEDVVKGKLAGVKGKDDAVMGTLELTGTAADSHVLAGQTYYNTDVKRKCNGTMANTGNHNASLNCGQSKAIPAGYTTGGTVTANSLASQTGGATADDSKVLSGYTYWRDGAKRTGNMAVQSIINFRAALYSTRAIMLTWQNPARGPYSGVAITYRTDGRYPNSVGDGVNCYDGSATNALILNLPANVGVYFRVWSYMTTSVGRMYGGNLDAYAVPQEIKGQQTFTTSGTFVVPENVKSIQIFCVGGGGPGGQCGTSVSENWREGAGGGGGGHTNTVSQNVSPGQQINVVIGACGAVTNAGNCHSSAGTGGTGGYYYEDWDPCPYGGYGGSGGAGAGGVGGSDGRSGSRTGNGYTVEGSGQGRTTRAFGEPSGTLYSGGGGGYIVGSSKGAGGDGGGAAAVKNASANTGGGGGACSLRNNNGGSGICIIRWGY